MTEKVITSTMFAPEAELALLKSAFEGNEVLLRTMKNLFFGYELTSGEKDLIRKSFASEELKRILRKRFSPFGDKSTPIGQTIDMWTGIDLVGKPKDEIFQTICVRKDMVDMMNKALNLLDNPDGEKPSIVYNIDSVFGDDFGIRLTTRNRFIGHIEFQCVTIQTIVNTKVETKEEKEKRQVANSSK